MSAVSEAERG
jgi:REP-associated tyrosine transposase